MGFLFLLSPDRFDDQRFRGLQLDGDYRGLSRKYKECQLLGTVLKVLPRSRTKGISFMHL